MVYVVTRYPYARPSGAGSPFRARGALHVLLASLSLLLLLIGAAFGGGGHGLSFAAVALFAGIVLLTTIAVMVGWGTWASRRLGGGLSGDTSGAWCVLVELAVLTLAPPLAGPAARIAL